VKKNKKIKFFGFENSFFSDVRWSKSWLKDKKLSTFFFFFFFFKQSEWLVLLILDLSNFTNTIVTFGA
jgi:hypothetical protein